MKQKNIPNYLPGFKVVFVTEFNHSSQKENIKSGNKTVLLNRIQSFWSVGECCLGIKLCFIKQD